MKYSFQVLQISEFGPHQAARYILFGNASAWAEIPTRR